ncbi:Y-family DNA polymerase [Teredinibacter turnerae]|uniref:Y-family DNA polymerase n=1 Tax=Teredinibacter turnerae TaxID=2426 RepID=UPI00042A2ECE|nr:DNA polymerase Y family protein [Teredinibacter turnerae]
MALSSKSLWLAVRLPYLPLEVFGFKHQTDHALITQKQRVLCASKPAVADGIRAGMPAATAQLLGQHQQVERDFALETAALNALADRLYMFTPHLTPLHPAAHLQAGILAEISRSLLLFKGLTTLVEQLKENLADTGYELALGLGHTDLCAWLLSWSPTAQPIRHYTQSQFIEQLDAMPVRHLGECHCAQLPYIQLQNRIEDLEKSGFNTIADLTRQIGKQNTSSLRRRWGGEFCDLLSHVLGIEHNLRQTRLFATPLPQYQPEQFFYDSIQFDYPLQTAEQLLQPMEYLLNNLQRYLNSQQLQCQKIEWLLFDIYHNKQTFNVHSSHAQNDAALLLELSRIQLETQTLSFEVDTVELICRDTFKHTPNTDPLGFTQYESNAREMAHDFAIVTAKLKARLGDQALFKVAYKDTHIPELSSAKAPLEQQTSTPHLPHAPRPSWLFDKPQPIQEKQQRLHWRGTITLLQGPERIEGNWWQQQTARDYFIAAREDGLRLWIFYDLHRRQWLVQGIFS